MLVAKAAETVPKVHMVAPCSGRLGGAVARHPPNGDCWSRGAPRMGSGSRLGSRDEEDSSWQGLGRRNGSHRLACSGKTRGKSCGPGRARRGCLPFLSLPCFRSAVALTKGAVTAPGDAGSRTSEVAGGGGGVLPVRVRSQLHHLPPPAPTGLSLFLCPARPRGWSGRGQPVPGRVGGSGQNCCPEARASPGRAHLPPRAPSRWARGTV